MDEVLWEQFSMSMLVNKTFHVVFWWSGCCPVAKK